MRILYEQDKPREPKAKVRPIVKRFQFYVSLDISAMLSLLIDVFKTVRILCKAFVAQSKCELILIPKNRYYRFLDCLEISTL